MCMTAALACVSLYHMHAVLSEARRGHRLLLGGVTDCCEPVLCGCWESNPGLLEEQ